MYVHMPPGPHSCTSPASERVALGPTIPETGPFDAEHLTPTEADVVLVTGDVGGAPQAATTAHATAKTPSDFTATTKSKAYTWPMTRGRALADARRTPSETRHLRFLIQRAGS
jgi:hypothetical protein